MPLEFETAALPAIVAELADATVKHRVGRRWLSENSQARHVVWIPMRGTYENPHQGGSHVVAGTPATRQRVIKNRVEFCEAHIYADSDENVEQLRENLVAAMSRAHETNFDPIGYAIETMDPPTPDRGKPHDAHTRWLSKIRLDFTIRYRTVDEIKPLTTITRIEVATTLNDELGSPGEAAGTLVIDETP